MSRQQKTRDLARSLLAREADKSTTSAQAEPATVRVYERLRRLLCAPVGAASFHALATRALVLAKSESPALSAVQVTADGCLRGLSEIEAQADTDQDGEAGVILIAQLLGLFLTFLGEATTLRLIEDLRLQVDSGTESGATTEEKVVPSDDPTETSAAFEGLLLEINRLRSVGDHI